MRRNQVPAEHCSQTSHRISVCQHLVDRVSGFRRPRVREHRDHLLQLLAGIVVASTDVAWGGAAPPVIAGNVRVVHAVTLVNSWVSCRVVCLSHALTPCTVASTACCHLFACVLHDRTDELKTNRLALESLRMIVSHCESQCRIPV
jgi:hypothetical protein